MNTKQRSSEVDHTAKVFGRAVDPLLTDFDLERLTRRARSSWQKARLTGNSPKFIRLGRLVRYRLSDVEAWLAEHPTLRSTSDNGEAA